MSSDWWAVIGTTLTTIMLVVPPTTYAWYVLDVWIGAGEVSYAKNVPKSTIRDFELPRLLAEVEPSFIDALARSRPSST